MSHGSPLSFPRSRKRRGWTAWCALLVLSWYSLGPLPWLLTSFDPATHPDALDTAADHDHDARAHHATDATGIPGSPTHPDDHDCAECSVLKYLAGCVLPAPVFPTVAALDAVPFEPPAPIGVQYPGHAAPIPPIRGPPQDHA